jgi:hypothetical protein
MRYLVALVSLGMGTVVGLQPEATSQINRRSFDGDELTCDLPALEHLANIASRRDGRGMCVMTSIEMAARWHGLETMRGLRDWCANQPGGAYPAKVDRQIREFCEARGVPIPLYAQYEGPHIDALLDRCDRTGRMACVTYGYSPRYGGTIAHMVCCTRFGPRYAVALDNNFPGTHSYEWMSRDEMRRRIVHPNGRGWVFVWLAPPPPPPPCHEP